MVVCDYKLVIDLTFDALVNCAVLMSYYIDYVQSLVPLWKRMFGCWITVVFVKISFCL